MAPTTNRRSNQRYPLQLPGALRLADAPEPTPALHVFTRDISSGGAFFVGNLPLAAGAELQVEMSMPQHSGTDLANLEVQGRVLRVEPGGAAVAFDEHYHLYAVGAGDAEQGDTASYPSTTAEV